MLKKAITIIGVAMGISVSTPVWAEPAARWWSGGGMGDIENGYSDGRGTEVLLSCNPERGHSLYLSTSIRGVSPNGEFLVFSVDGRDFEFSADNKGFIELTSRISVNSMHFLFDALREGKVLVVRFSSHSLHAGATEREAWRLSMQSTRLRTKLSLKGTQSTLSKNLCGRD